MPIFFSNQPTDSMVTWIKLVIKRKAKNYICSRKENKYILKIYK
jgi:hypothetical protein